MDTTHIPSPMDSRLLHVGAIVEYVAAAKGHLKYGSAEWIALDNAEDSLRALSISIALGRRG